jgi:ABC-2 type transport system ATP-binding protein
VRAAIQVDGLIKTYGDVRALDELSFTVEPGTVFGLLGPNGAGKSTSVRILTTLVRADRGTAQVAGFDVERDAAEVRRAIGVVAQSSGADIQATARENLRLQGQLYGRSGPGLERRVDELLQRFGLAKDGDRLVRTFSGGMQRRLDVALALVNEPRVLFLDEPTTGLDPEIRTEMWEEIRRLTAEGLTVLLTTHYLEEADALATRLAIVDRGSVVAEGAPEELKSELRGDAIHVELDGAGEPGGVPDLLERVAGVHEVQMNGTGLHARANDGARTVPAVLHALEEHGVKVASVTVARPSLDDVYLRYAGRTFSAAEEETR